MIFAPKSKDELASSSLLPVGWYDFEVITAEEAVSKKSGKDMIKLKLRVFAGNGERHIYDYLIETAANHLFDFCDATGLIVKYDAGTLKADDCVGRAAKVKIGIDDKNPDFPPKNVAKDYAAPDRLRPSKPAPAPLPADDDIPF